MPGRSSSLAPPGPNKGLPSPENIRLYPKAAPCKTTHRWRRSKSTILTDTPEKEALEEEKKRAKGSKKISKKQEKRRNWSESKEHLADIATVTRGRGGGATGIPELWTQSNASCSDVINIKALLVVMSSSGVYIVQDSTLICHFRAQGCLTKTYVV